MALTLYKSQRLISHQIIKPKQPKLIIHVSRLPQFQIEILVLFQFFLILLYLFTCSYAHCRQSGKFICIFLNESSFLFCHHFSCLLFCFFLNFFLLVSSLIMIDSFICFSSQLSFTLLMSPVFFFFETLSVYSIYNFYDLLFFWLVIWCFFFFCCCFMIIYLFIHEVGLKKVLRRKLYIPRQRDHHKALWKSLFCLLLPDCSFT